MVKGHFGKMDQFHVFPTRRKPHLIHFQTLKFSSPLPPPPFSIFSLLTAQPCVTIVRSGQYPPPPPLLSPTALFFPPSSLHSLYVIVDAHNLWQSMHALEVALCYAATYDTHKNGGDEVVSSSDLLIRSMPSKLLFLVVSSSNPMLYRKFWYISVGDCCLFGVLLVG